MVQPPDPEPSKTVTDTASFEAIKVLPASLTWTDLASLTPARVALGRAGSGLRTNALLAFALDHARARDAIHAPFRIGDIEHGLRGLGLAAVCLQSRAASRDIYLKRPDLGRRVAEGALQRIPTPNQPLDVAIVIADGLSATAVQAHALDVIAALRPRLNGMGLTCAPITIVTNGRVAIGDEIGAYLKTRLVVVLIGERPGLSAPDSLGAYVTFAPQIGRRDSERNCISNIRAAGLAPVQAAEKISWLIGEALRRRLTGVALKDESSNEPVLSITPQQG